MNTEPNDFVYLVRRDLNGHTETVGFVSHGVELCCMNCCDLIKAGLPFHATSYVRQLRYCHYRDFFDAHQAVLDAAEERH